MARATCSPERAFLAGKLRDKPCVSELGCSAVIPAHIVGSRVFHAIGYIRGAELNARIHQMEYRDEEITIIVTGFE